MSKSAVYVIGGSCFVVHPAARGFWIKTHPSVAMVACPECASEVGVPCQRRSGYVAWTHLARRHAARALPKSESITIHYRAAR